MKFLHSWCLKSVAVLATALACFTSAAMASDFEVSLQVKSSKQKVSTKRTEELPSSKTAEPRPVFGSMAHETLLFSWKATNVGKQETFKDVLVHCVVVPEKEPGQPDVPNLKYALQESALTMDFKPGGTATGEFSLTIDEPGAYLVRIETRQMIEKHGHEHYAALDLVCK